MSILRGKPFNFNTRECENFAEYLFKKLTEDPQRVLMIDGVTHKKFTSQWIWERTLLYVQVLLSFGLKEKDVIGICSENSVDMACIVYAALYLGVSVNPLNFLYSPSEFRHMFSLTRPKVVFCSPVTEKVIGKCFEDQKLEERPMIVVISDKEGEDSLSTGRLLKKMPKKSPEELPIRRVNSGENIAGIFSSSGTTGLPKGVALSQKSLYYNIQLTTEVLFSTPENEVNYLTFLPWFHLMGFMWLYLMPVMRIKSTILLPHFEPKLFFSSIQRYKITSLVLAPPIVVFLAKDPSVSNYDLTSVREIYSGAAPLQAETEKAVYKRFPNIKVIRQGYGMTEGLTFVLPPVPKDRPLKQGTVGLLAKGTEAKVVDPETGKLLGPNQPGELRFRGPQLLSCYYNNPKATGDAFDEAGFLKTGDVGFVDSEGYFFIVDRIKDLIKYKGLQVAPAELESLLLTHPKILDAAVIGIPDERCGELPMAFVVKKPRRSDEGELLEKEVVEFVANEMSQAKRLHGGCQFVDAIPKNPSGKILRRVLRDQLRSKNRLKHKL